MQDKIEITKTPRPGSAIKTGKLISAAEVLVKQGHLDQALKTLGRCTLLEPGSDRVYILRAEVYRQMRQYPLALADLNQAITLNTDKPTAYIKRGEIYRALIKPREALLDLNQAIRLDPTNSRALGQRGIIYRHFKEFNRSLVDFNRAIRLDPNNPWLYGNRAEIYRCLKDYPKAIDDYNRVLTLNPSATWVYERRSYPYLWSGDLDAALSDFEKARKANPSDLMSSWMAEWLGMCREGFSFTPEIKERLKSLANSNPQHYAGYLCRASLYWEHRVALKESYNQAETASRLMLDNPQAYFWQGMAAAGMGENEEAYTLMQKALDLGIYPALLSPVHWLEKVNPVFYKEYGQLLLTNGATGGNSPTAAVVDQGPLTNIEEHSSRVQRAGQVQSLDDEVENPGIPFSQTKKPGSGLFILLRFCLLVPVGIGFALVSGSAPATPQFGNPAFVQGNTRPLAANALAVAPLSAITVTNQGPIPTGYAAGEITGPVTTGYSRSPGPVGYTQGLKQTGPTGKAPSAAGQTVNNTGQAITTSQTEANSPAVTPPVTNPVAELPAGPTPQFQDVIPPKATNTPINLLKTRTPKASPTAKSPVNPLLPGPVNNTEIPPQPTSDPVTVPPSNSNPVATDTPVADPISTPLPQVIPTAAPTDTPVPGGIPTQVPTNTAVPPAMPTDTPQPTIAPSSTPIPTAAPTDTPIPTAVPTDTPVPTAIPTDTPVPTAIPTNTPIPTVAPTSTPVPTPVPTNIPPPTKKPKPTRR